MQSGTAPSQDDIPQYIFVNGMPKPNPAYRPAGTAVAPPAYGEHTLAVATTMEEHMALSEMTKLPPPPQYQQTYEKMHSQDYIQSFGREDISASEMYRALSNWFRQNSIPIGLMSILTGMQKAIMFFMIDDSESMSRNSTLLRINATPYMQRKVPEWQTYLTRWQEAEDRMHILVDLLAIIPTGKIIMKRFDHPPSEYIPEGLIGERIELVRTGKTPQQFALEAHNDINTLFLRAPDHGTPIFKNMQNMLNEANAGRMHGSDSDQMTMHILMTDGEPGGGRTEIDKIKNLLSSDARYPKYNPTTICGCSDDNTDYAWMDEVEEIDADKNVAAVADYAFEAQRVMKNQGPAMPYNRGIWILCTLAAAINRSILDALNEPVPFTKPTLQIYLGRGLMDQEYMHYFQNVCTSQDFQFWFQSFVTANVATDLEPVKVYNKALAAALNEEIDQGEDDSEERDKRRAGRVLTAYRLSTQPTTAAVITQQSGARYSNNSAAYGYGVQQAPQQQPAPAACCTIA